jgi:hypothetical protein
MLTMRSSQMQAMADANPNQQQMQPCPKDATWIEFQLVDQDGKPVPGVTYSVRLPDNSQMQGTLDDEGKVRFGGIVPGDATISFPTIDASEWKPLSGA